MVILGALVFWFYRKNVFSKEVLKLEILGPEKVAMGDEIEYVVKYKNTGQSALEEAKLTFEFPEYSLLSEGDNLRVEKKLDDIYPGEEKTVSFKGSLVGKENDTKVAKARLTFKPRNLKASFESSTTFTSEIQSIPVNFEFDLSSKVEGGRDLSFSLNYFSNCDLPLSNLAIKIDYPSGFEFSESKPRGVDKNEWEIPLLNKTEGGRIEIKGKLNGEIFEQKIFKASLGIWKDNQFIVIKEAQKGVEIINPSIYISSQINGSPNYKASSGDLLYYEVFFRNVGDKPFENLFLTVQLEGNAFDLNTLRANSGNFRQGENTILWDDSDLSNLKFLDSSDEGKVEFWVKLKNDLPFAVDRDKNPSVKVKVTMGQLRQDFITKINSKISISQTGLFADGAISSSGPIPPKVGESTTYVIEWKVVNYYNDLRNVKVKAQLPQQVRLTGTMNPEDARLTFDQDSREIVWEVGDLWALNQSQELSFQIAFVPISSQRGQTAEIISDAKITAEDLWTESEIQTIAPAIDTDSINGQAQGIIQ